MLWIGNFECDNIALLVESAGDNFTFFTFIFFSCLRRPTFFQQQKKVGKKCRSQSPRGWHSANRFCNTTSYSGLCSWDAIRMSAANRTHALCMMILSKRVSDGSFYDGLKYCVTSVINTKDTHSYIECMSFLLFDRDQRPRISRSLFNSLLANLWNTTEHPCPVLGKSYQGN